MGPRVLLTWGRVVWRWCDGGFCEWLVVGLVRVDSWCPTFCVRTWRGHSLLGLTAVKRVPATYTTTWYTLWGLDALPGSIKAQCTHFEAFFASGLRFRIDILLNWTDLTDSSQVTELPTVDIHLGIHTHWVTDTDLPFRGPYYYMFNYMYKPIYYSFIGN